MSFIVIAFSCSEVCICHLTLGSPWTWKSPPLSATYMP